MTLKFRSLRGQTPIRMIEYSTDSVKLYFLNLPSSQKWQLHIAQHPGRVKVTTTRGVEFQELPRLDKITLHKALNFEKAYWPLKRKSVQIKTGRSQEI